MLLIVFHIHNLFLQDRILPGCRINIRRYANRTERRQLRTMHGERNQRLRITIRARLHRIRGDVLPKYPGVSVLLRGFRRNAEGSPSSGRPPNSANRLVRYVLRMRRLLRLRYRKDGHVLGHGFLPTHSDAVRDNMADRSDALHPQVRLVRLAVN